MILGLVIGAIITIIGLFVGNIIVFDSIALGIIAGALSNGLLHIHPAFALLIAIAVFLIFFFLQHTKVGFWIISVLLSLAWGFIFGILAMAFSNNDYVWMYVIWGLGTLVMFLLHLRARGRLEEN